MKAIVVSLVLFCCSWPAAFVTGQNGGVQNVIDAFTSEFEGLRDCPIGVPDEVLNECIQLVLQDLRKFIASGEPSVNIPPGGPLRLAEVSLDLPIQNLLPQRLRAAIPIKSAWRNLEVRGLSNFTRGTAAVDTKAKSLTVDLDYPEITLSVDYMLTGRLFGLGFQRQGRVIVRALNIRLDHKTFVFLDAKTQTLQPRSVDATASFGEIHVDMPELAQSGPLGSAFLAAINRGLKLLKPVLDRYSRGLVSPLSLAVQKSPQYQPLLRAFSYFFIPYLSR